MNLEGHLSLMCEFKVFIVCSTNADYPGAGGVVVGAIGGFVIIVVIVTMIVFYHLHHHQQCQPCMFNKSAFQIRCHCFFTTLSSSLYPKCVADVIVVCSTHLTPGSSFSIWRLRHAVCKPVEACINTCNVCY